MAELSKAIGPWRGTAMMLNIVLGAGLLTLPGLAVQSVGSAAIVVWLVCALAASPLLVIFALIARDHPDAGGIAAVLRRAFGGCGYVPATFLFLGAVIVGLPAIALTGGYYAAAAFGGPPHLHAAGLILFAMAANLASAEIAGRINTVIASFVLAILLTIAVVGWWIIEPEWAAVHPSGIALPGWQAFGLAFMMVFFAFTGWEVAANLSGEFRDPGRNIPIAMGLSFAIAVALYIALAVLVVASGPAGAVEAPFASIFGTRFGPAGAAAISMVAVLLIFANLSAALWAVSRMVYSAATEGLLFEPFTTLRYGVPLNAVFLTAGALLTVVGLSFVGWLDLGELLAMAGQNFLLLYGGAAAALVQLSSKPWHRRLGWGGLFLVAVLVSARGGEGLLYPGCLIAVGLAVAGVRARMSVVVGRSREGSACARS